MLSLTWHGNATLTLSGDDFALAIDPYLASDALNSPERYAFLAAVEAILVTHGHFDHVAHLPALAARFRQPIYAPEAVLPALARSGAFAPGQLLVASPQASFFVGGAQLTPLLGAHVRFDAPLIAQTLLRVVASPKQSAEFIRRHGFASYPLGGCLAWLIEHRGFRLLHFGSLAMAPNVSYPQDVDLLCLPVQGHSRICDLAFKAVSRLKPRKVLFHHFDDAFPPLSQTIELSGLVARLNAAFPELSVVVPRRCEPLILLG